MGNKSEYNKNYYRANNPYPVRLGCLKTKLQEEAFEMSSSIPERIRDIISSYYEKREIKIDIATQKLIEMVQHKKPARRVHVHFGQLELFSQS